ncbi:MAG: hypothetical protein FJW95_06540, partial [Actinobacteria bacterium]|nr:hypothetical protein [Actinomycetota bacterium]
MAAGVEERDRSAAPQHDHRPGAACRSGDPTSALDGGVGRGGVGPGQRGAVGLGGVGGGQDHDRCGGVDVGAPRAQALGRTGQGELGGAETGDEVAAAGPAGLLQHPQRGVDRGVPAGHALG